jgi:hypothetical protein
MKTIHYVSAPAGSGKTFALAGHSVDLANNHQKVMIVQPTRQLIRQTAIAIRNRDKSVKLTTIISPTMGNSRVLSRVIAHMESADHGVGEVLLISHDILEKLPHAYRQFWHVFVDEMPGGFEAYHLQIAVTHEHVTAHLKADQELTGDAMMVEALNEGALRVLAENPNKDAGLAIFHDLANSVLNPNKLVLVNRQNYARLTFPNGLERVTSFFSILQPGFLSDFQSVTIMGANLEETELYLLWEKLLDVTWVKHPGLSKSLRFNSHESGSRLTIKYFINGNWSKHHAALPHNGASVLDAITERMEVELGDDFLWQANKGVEDSHFAGGIRLPNKAHGQNRAQFMSCNKVALVSALNHQKAASDFLKLINFTQDEIKTVLQYQNEYQAMMRCSLRDVDATAPVTVIVVSKGSADWLAARFPGCKVERIDNDIPEPGSVGPKPTGARKSRAEIQDAYRKRKKAEKAAMEARLASLARGDQQP